MAKSKIIFPCSIIFILISGCVTRNVIDDFGRKADYFNRINQCAEKDKAKIIFTYGKKTKTDSLFITSDSLSYVTGKGKIETIHNTFAEKIVFINRKKGVVQGLWAGPVAFSIYAIALAFGDSDTVIDSDEAAFRSFGEFLGFATVSAAAGAGLGLIIGTINGQRDVYPVREAYKQFREPPADVRRNY